MKVSLFIQYQYSLLQYDHKFDYPLYKQNKLIIFHDLNKNYLSS